MLHKDTFTLEVDLLINEVTCPGVWLCPYGRLSLEVYMLDSCVQTARIKPIFPLDFNEQYLFHKTFEGSFHNSHLKGTFENEFIYMELIQWDCDGLYGGVLASFRCSLEELLLFPSLENAKLCKCSSVELLMQPSKSFPGILSPKIEITTETSIKKGLYSLTSLNNANINGTTKARTPSPSRKVLCQLRQHNSCTSMRQRRVCHSTNYHKSRKCFPKMQPEKPIFTYRKPDSSLIMRQVQGLGTRKCRCCNEYRSVANVLRDCMCAVSADEVQHDCDLCDNDYQTRPSTKKIDLSSIIPSSCSSKKCYSTDTRYYPKCGQCMCGDDHSMDVCSTCAKYMYYFDCNC